LTRSLGFGIFRCDAPSVGRSQRHVYCELHACAVMSDVVFCQHYDCPLHTPFSVFEMLIVPQLEFPLLCVGVSCR